MGDGIAMEEEGRWVEEDSERQCHCIFLVVLECSGRKCNSETDRLMNDESY